MSSTCAVRRYFCEDQETFYTWSDADSKCPSCCSNPLLKSHSRSFRTMLSTPMTVVSTNGDAALDSPPMRLKTQARCTRQVMAFASAIAGMVSMTTYGVRKAMMICAMDNTVVALMKKRNIDVEDTARTVETI